MNTPSIAIDSSSPATSDARYEPFIDGIRGMLATYVVLHHLFSVVGFQFAEGEVLDARGWLDWLLYGHNAVVAFIFISGLCLGMPVVRSLETSGVALRRGAIGFYIARGRRILPAYYAALFIGFLAALLLTHFGATFQASYFLPLHTASVIGSLLLVPNLVDGHNGSGVIWSLGVELQIYLFFPIFCAIWRRYGIGILFCVILVCASIVEAYLPHSLGQFKLVGGTVSGLCPSFYVVFAMGLVAAVLFSGKTEKVRTIRESIPWGILLVTFIAVTYTRGTRWGLLSDPENYATALFMFLLVMTIQRHARIRWLFDRQIPVQVGTFSYSLYLVHLPLINILFLWVYRQVWPKAMQGNFLRAFLFQIGVGIPIMMAFAALFARYFEWPFMNSRARRAAAKSYRPPEQVEPPISADPVRSED